MEVTGITRGCYCLRGLGCRGDVSWASFVGIWGSAELVKSKKVLSSDGGVWNDRLLLMSISGVVCLVVCVLVSVSEMHVVRYVVVELLLSLIV